MEPGLGPQILQRFRGGALGRWPHCPQNPVQAQEYGLGRGNLGFVRFPLRIRRFAGHHCFLRCGEQLPLRPNILAVE